MDGIQKVFLPPLILHSPLLSPLISFSVYIEEGVVGWQAWPSGVMDSASDFGSEGCGFKSHLGRYFLLQYIAYYSFSLASFFVLISN